MTVTIEQIENAIDIPAQKWRGRCYEIASAIERSGLLHGYVAVYGHFTGFVAVQSMFYNAHMKAGFVRHGWLVNEEDDHIIDPTRWVFEATAPKLWTGYNVCGAYDEGANVFAQMMMRPFPNDDEFQTNPQPLLLDGDAKSVVTSLTGKDPTYLTSAQVFWLSNLPYTLFQGEAPAVYAAIIKAGLSGFIPIDNRMKAERGNARV